MSDQQAATMDRIEAEIGVTRQRLAETLDVLAVRAQPKEIARRQVESAKAKFDEATRTPDGELRIERVAGVVAAVTVLLVVLGLLRRRRG